MNGTITKWAKKSGRFSWGYVCDGAPDENGKRKQVTKQGFSTKTEADAALRAAIAALGEAISDFNEKRQAPPPPGLAAVPTFGEFFPKWIREHAARRCSPKTLEAYEQHGRYAIREFGSLRLDELTPQILETALNRLQDSGGRNGNPLSPKSLSHIRSVVNAALKKAVNWGLIARNCMEQVDHAVKGPKREPKVLDNVMLRQLLDRASTTRLYPLLVLAASTGARRGELLALQWSDLNFETGALVLSKSLEETRHGLRVKSTKSNKPRTFTIPASALSVLADHRRHQDTDRALYGSDYEENHLVFCRPEGAYYCPDQMSVRVTSFAKKAGLPGIGLHSLRHSHASQLISSGAPITVISDRLGHANSAITLSIYSHALPADVSAAAKLWNDAMKDVIGESRKPAPTRMLGIVRKKA